MWPAAGRRAAAIFVVALAARAVYLAAIYSGDASLSHGDSAMWLLLAADPTGWMGTAERMPLYPLYLKLVAGMFGPDPLFAVCGQLVIDSATCVVVARIAARLCGPENGRAVWIAGLLAAFNPTQIVMSAVLLGDTLFVFFVAGTIDACLRWLERPDARVAAFAGLWAGLAFLNRAVILPPLVLMPVAFAALALWRGSAPFQALRHAAFFAVTAGAFVAPVVAHNWIAFGEPGVTAQGGYHAAHWIVPLVREAKDGTPFATTAAEVGAEFERLSDENPPTTPFETSRLWTRIARARLVELGAGAIAKAWATGMAINLLSPAVLMSPPLMQLPRTGFYATTGRSPLDKMATFLWSNDNANYARWLLAGAAIELPLKMLALAGLASCLFRPGRRLAATALAGWALFVLLASGPVAAPKYRLPIEPVCIAFAAAAFRRPKSD